MRKALSHTITPKLLDALKVNPSRMHLIADYKAKPLPTGHRKTQTAAYGKTGLSLHGVTALRWNAQRGDFAALNIRDRWPVTTQITDLVPHDCGTSHDGRPDH